LPYRFVGVGNRGRNYIASAGPLTKIDQAAAFAAKREVRVSGLHGLLTDRAAELDEALARHSRIAEVRGQIVEVRRFLPYAI
jgi:hypothetical protein